MPSAPDVRPTSHDRHDPLLVAALAGADLAATDRVHATHLIETCPDCASLHADLIAIARATAAVPPPITTRPRDFRLSPEQARRLRPSGWRRVLAAFAGPRLAFTKPLGVGLATIGLAGLLLGNVSLGSFGAMSASAPGYPATAAASGATSGSTRVNDMSTGDGAGSGFGAEAGPGASAPAASSAYAPAAMPSPAASAPAASAAPASSAPFSSPDEVRAVGLGKTTSPAATAPPREAVGAGNPARELAPGPDLRTMIFVAAVLIGLGLLVLRRVARGVSAA
jgi:hypothetical protein